MDSQQVAELITLLTVKVDNVKTGVDQAIKSIKDYEGNTKSANAEAGASFLRMAASVGLSYEALKAFVVSGIEAATQAEELGIALNTVAENTGVASSEINAQRTSIQGLNFTIKDANGLLLAMARAHVDVSKASQVASAATLYAKVSGQSYEDTLSQLATTIETGMPRGLIQFGIGMSTVRAAMEAAKESSHAYGGELTDTERSTAMLNLILMKTADLQGLNSKATGTASNEYRTLGQNFKIMAEYMGDSFNKLMMTKIGVALPEAPKEIKKNNQNKELEKQLATNKELKKSLEDLLKTDLDLNLNKKDFADKTLGNVLAKEEMIAKVTGKSKEQEIKDLMQIATQYKNVVDAQQQEILAGAITKKMLDLEAEEAKKNSETRKKMASELASSTTESFMAMTGLFGKTASDIGTIWKQLLEKMVQQALTSGLSDIFAKILGGGAGQSPGGGADILGFLSKALGIGATIATGGAAAPFVAMGGAMSGSFTNGTVGYDDPVNDSRAYAMGGKWFSDVIHKFSQGYVNQSTSPTGASALGGLIPGGGDTHYHSYSFSSILPYSPSQQRKAGKTIANIIQKGGFKTQ